MSQVDAGDNREPPAGPPAGARPRPRPAQAVLLVTGLAWAFTMVQVLRSEVLTRRDSEDIRALVDSARLTRQHAAARWVVRASDSILGTFTSAVSGSRDEQQLAYVIEGELLAPLNARLKGILLATWDRRPERFVLDLDLSGVRHRVDGTLTDAGTLRVRYLAPGASPEEALTWDIVDPPSLGPGPLPLPVFGKGGGARSGSLQDPGAGGEFTWKLADSRMVTVAVAGSLRQGRLHELQVRGMTLAVILDETGLPLRLELPGGIVAELSEDQ